VMMKITMLDVTLMVVIVAEMMSTPVIAKFVNVLKELLLLQQPLKDQTMAVALNNGLETTSAMMETTMLNVTLMVEIVVVMMSIPNIAQFVNVLKEPLLLQQPLRVLELAAALKHGLETTSVMIKTTMLNANLMVVTVVEKMSIPNIAQLVNVLKEERSVNFPIGKEMVGVMMETTMLDVLGMVVIAAEMMSKPNIVKNVNVLILPLLQKFVDPHNGKVTTIVMMKTTMLDVTLMVVIVVALISTQPTALNVSAKNNSNLSIPNICS